MMVLSKSKTNIDSLLMTKAKIAGLRRALKILPIAQLTTIISALVITVIFYGRIRSELFNFLVWACGGSFHSLDRNGDT